MRRRDFVGLVATSAFGLLAGCEPEQAPGEPSKKGGTATKAGTKVPGTAAPTAASDKPPYPTTTLCGKCGQVKGSDLCCCNKPDQERCPMCGLFKGSPGCCRINKPEVQAGALAVAGKTGEAVAKPPYPVPTLCGKCGQVKGSDLCCCKKPDQPRCAKCGLFKGSPGCCRINKPAVQKAAMKQAKA